MSARLPTLRALLIPLLYPTGYLLTTETTNALDAVRPDLTAGPCALRCNTQFGATASYQVKLSGTNHCHCGNSAGNSLRVFSNSGGSPMFALIKVVCRDAKVTSESSQLLTGRK